MKELFNELFEGRLPESSSISTPIQLDGAHPVNVGERVFINEGLDCMTCGSITIEDDIMIGPQVTILTPNHDLDDLFILKCKSVVIKKGAWIAARAVVTKDVALRTVVWGNLAKLIKKLD